MELKEFVVMVGSLSSVVWIFELNKLVRELHNSNP